MILWRISNHISLTGQGGLFASARWHTQGRRIVYLAASPAAALLEVLVHLDLEESVLPENYLLLKANVPKSVSRTRLMTTSLDPGWEDNPMITRQLGDQWLRKGATALFAVPSALVPDTWNWLLNPMHADAVRVSIEWSRRFPYDGRLLRSGGFVHRQN